MLICLFSDCKEPFLYIPYKNHTYFVKAYYTEFIRISLSAIASSRRVRCRLAQGTLSQSSQTADASWTSSPPPQSNG